MIISKFQICIDELLTLTITLLNGSCAGNKKKEPKNDEGKSPAKKPEAFLWHCSTDPCLNTKECTVFFSNVGFIQAGSLKLKVCEPDIIMT